MIRPDPRCPRCRGTGLERKPGFERAMFPCVCRMEINNCDRCSTLALGEERAPTSAWVGPTAVLCESCRRAVYPPTLTVHASVGGRDPVVISGTQEGLQRLREAIRLALQLQHSETRVHTPDGVEVPLLVQVK